MILKGCPYFSSSYAEQHVRICIYDGLQSKQIFCHNVCTNNMNADDYDHFFYLAVGRVSTYGFLFNDIQIIVKSLTWKNQLYFRTCSI